MASRHEQRGMSAQAFMAGFSSAGRDRRAQGACPERDSFGNPCTLHHPVPGQGQHLSETGRTWTTGGAQ